MQFTSKHSVDGGVVERGFTLGEASGILWTSETASTPVPLILLGHPGGLNKMRTRLAGRARRAAVDGFASATIELPGSGDRPRLPIVEQARADLRRALEAGETVGDEIVERLIFPLVEQAVPEWQGALDANDRQLALDLFDAFGSREKTLNANMGGHAGVPQHAGEGAARFFVRHLTGSRTRTGEYNH